MGDRTTRFWIAVLLTGMDIAVFEHCFGVIWQTCSGDPWSRGAFLLLLVLLAASAIVLWIHVYYDLRQTMRERYGALSLKPVPIPGKLRRDGDV